MSSGTVKKEPFNLSEQPPFFNASFNLETQDIQRKKFSFISGLMSMLFKHKTNQDTFKNISNFMVLALNTNNNDLSQKLEGDFKDYLTMLNQIRTILINNPKLSNKQKFECCRIERFFMKLYLKEYLFRLQY